MNEQEAQIVLNEGLILKFKLNLTPQQVEDALDREVINGCLILKKE